MIAVGGSSPGIFGLPGLAFASEGVATLALAYFGMPGLPRTFERIPLEYFAKALSWLAPAAARSIVGRRSPASSQTFASGA